MFFSSGHIFTDSQSFRLGLFLAAGAHCTVVTDNVLVPVRNTLKTHCYVCDGGWMGFMSGCKVDG